MVTVSHYRIDRTPSCGRTGKQLQQSLSAILFRDQLSKEPAGCRADPNAIDVTYLEVNRGCPKRVVLDEDAMDDSSNSLCPVSVDGRCHRFVEMGILVVGTWIRCSREYEFDHVVD